ncbi:general secretion pathway protein GspB [Salinisphaera japonica]|uniref:Type II secretion system protein GspB C-terminal domain-containing protein n=1 Tax=Salinisphaera japonica YTM-1 TaxID=1209778 RepID=A0A423Q2M6_9GAMM|nr:general secretion pathway protein GspB [Salinisphaera japonica]ROO32803.1 hypothetical protein SAJA_00795 [Salinisphaera japonica YTM-1]
MSYLVDALKKAERERRAGDASSLHHAAAMDPARRRGAGYGRWLLAGLIAINVALVVYIWRPQAIAPTAPEPAAPSVKATTPAPQVTSNTGNETGAEPGPAKQEQKPDTPGTGSPPTITRQTVARPAASAAPDAGGQVSYSDVPLTEASSTPAPETTTRARDARGETQPAAINGPTSQADESALMSQNETSAPAITINGQLYSTVPGRSFILVDGRRYHEGERLAAGPAVEQIEPSGAVLRYQGQRYRVAGPG